MRFVMTEMYRFGENVQVLKPHYHGLGARTDSEAMHRGTFPDPYSLRVVNRLAVLAPYFPARSRGRPLAASRIESRNRGLLRVPAYYKRLRRLSPLGRPNAI